MNSPQECTCSPTSTTTPMKTASTMKAASKARLPAGRKTSDVSAVIKTAKSARACSWLHVRSRRPVKSRIPNVASVKRVTVVKVPVVEAGVIKIVAINNRAAVGDISVVVVDHPMAMPVPSPVIPVPAKSTEETDSKSGTEVESRTAIKDSGHRIPTWVG